eukprot:m.204182 g.204182  ORF g.204182 m.204182 type:complete len:711 (-) comp22438_c0_seq1:118-2250(-)
MFCREVGLVAAGMAAGAAAAAVVTMIGSSYHGDNDGGSATANMHNEQRGDIGTATEHAISRPHQASDRDTRLSHTPTECSSSEPTAAASSTSNDPTPINDSATASTSHSGMQSRHSQSVLTLTTTPAVVYQTRTDAGSGNALQACVASLFHVPLHDIPDFIHEPNGYMSAIEQTLRPSGWVPVKIDLGKVPSNQGGGGSVSSQTGHVDTGQGDAGVGSGAKTSHGANGTAHAHSTGRGGIPTDLPAPLKPGDLVILRGKSPRGPHGHVVVARVRHQPHHGHGDGTGTSTSSDTIDTDDTGEERVVDETHVVDIDTTAMGHATIPLHHAFDVLVDPHPDGTFLDTTAPLGWAMVFQPSPTAPVVVLAGGAQRIVHNVHPASAWELVPCETIQEVLELDESIRQRVRVLVIGPFFKPHVPTLVDPDLFPHLGLLQTMSAGYEWLDFKKLPPHMAVCNTSSMDHAIAEYVLAALLHFEVGLPQLAATMRQPPYLFLPPFHRRPIGPSGRLGNAPFRSELLGKTVGIVGMGRIGNQVAQRARAFGVRLIGVRGHTPTPVPPGFDWAGGSEELDRLLSESDYVVVACALNNATRGLLNAARLSKMQPSAVVINVARGPVIDEHALFDALKQRTIRGAAIDVWYRYPKAGDDPHGVPASSCAFHELDPCTVLLTPHASGWTNGQEERKAVQIAGNLDAMATGIRLDFVIKSPESCA